MADIYRVTVTVGFSAAHRLRGYCGECESLHGHNWKVEVTAQAGQLDDIGLALDFRTLKAAAREVVALLDHKYINEVEPFDRINPSSENMARFIFERIEERIADHRVRLQEVAVWESDTSRASYSRG